MSENDNELISSWRDRIAKRSAPALVEIDVRQSGGRPPAPQRLSDEERSLWEQLIFSRRPGWFSGAEAVLESYVCTTVHLQKIERELRKTKPSTGSRYQKLARLHRQTVAVAANLATRLRLTPSARIAKTQPQVGDLPMA